jgi:hypothetical protein
MADTSESKATSEIRASRFVLVDETGKDRAVLEMRQGEPILQLVGSNGRVQVQIGIIKEWGGVPHAYFESPDESSFLRMDAAKEGMAGIQLGASHRRVYIYSNRLGEVPTIELYDDQAHAVARLPAHNIGAVANDPLNLPIPPDLAGGRP